MPFVNDNNLRPKSRFGKGTHIYPQGFGDVFPEEETLVVQDVSTKKPNLLVGFPFFEARFARKPSPSGTPVMTSEVFDPFGLLISFAGSENPCFSSLLIT